MATTNKPVLVQTPDQIETLAALASEIYHEYFTIIITVEQIDYMVEKFLSVPVLTKAIGEELAKRVNAGAASWAKREAAYFEWRMVISSKSSTPQRLRFWQTARR